MFLGISEIRSKKNRVDGNKILDPHGDYPHGLVAWRGGEEVRFDKLDKDFLSVEEFEKRRAKRAAENLLNFLQTRHEERRKIRNSRKIATPACSFMEPSRSG